MNRLYILCFIFIALKGNAQEGENWTKTLREDHVRIHGTVAYMILDQPGWAQSPTNPNLILNEELQAYLFIEQKRVSIDDFENEWLPILLGDEKPDDMHPVRFEDHHGNVIRLTSQTSIGDQMLWMVYLGNADRVLDIKAAYEKDKDSVLGPQIMAMVRSIYIDPNAVIQLFETVQFSAEVEKYGFLEEASYMANSLIITNPETNRNIQFVLTDQESTKEEVMEMERGYLIDQEADIVLQESSSSPHQMEMVIYRSPYIEEGSCTFSATIFLPQKSISVSTTMEHTPENEQMFREICASVKLK